MPRRKKNATQEPYSVTFARSGGLGLKAKKPSDYFRKLGKRGGAKRAANLRARKSSTTSESVSAARKSTRG